MQQLNIEELEQYLLNYSITIPKKTSLLKEIKKQGVDLINWKNNPSHILYSFYFLSLFQIARSFTEQKKLILSNKRYFKNWYDVDELTKYLIYDDFSKMFSFAKRLLKEKNLFLRRMAYVLFIFNHNIDENDVDILIKTIQDNPDSEYYVAMAQAWLLATLAIKYFSKVYQFLLTGNISKDLLSKTKGKIRDSFRIDEENKLLIKNLKRNDIIKKIMR